MLCLRGEADERTQLKSLELARCCVCCCSSRGRRRRRAETMEEGRKRVVVVGGGVAGSLTSKLLENAADVTLVDPKDYFEVPYAALRCLVEPAFSERSVMTHSSYLKKAKVVISTAKIASSTQIITDDGEIVPYDFLVICTGSSYTGPKTRPERIQEYWKANSKVVAAQSILIMGGGPVGVEMAGEMVTDFPDKKVTIVTASSRLLTFLGSKASDKCLKWFKSKKVDVIFNDKVNPDSKSGSTYTTNAGMKIEADIHFWCIGKRLGNTWIEESDFFEYVRDGEGRLKVDANLRLLNMSNVFAAGDITDIQEIKQGYLAGKHAGVVAENIKKLIKDPTSTKLTCYEPMVKAMGIVNLGRKTAVAQLPFGTFLGCLPAMLKGKDLFVGGVRKQLGLPK